jgi:V8-like Glu-specific endopeptidase
MKCRRHGLFASTTLVMLAALTACHAGSSAKGGGSSDSVAPAAASVVTHVLEAKPDDPRTVFRSGPVGTAPIPTGQSVNGKLTAQSFDGIPKAGAVFFSVGGVVSAHYCTGSVVHSPTGNLIVTAAHCVRNRIFGGWQDHIVFVPGYHDDIAPYGAWVATTAYLDSKWVASEDPDADIAFLSVRKVGGGSQSLESITGASTFTASPGYTNPVSVVSYPLTASRPVGCGAPTKKFSDTQLELDCAGLPEGASGSPFLASGDRLVGILGGYQQGGSSPDTSYSIYFTDRIAAIFKSATGS